MGRFSVGEVREGISGRGHNVGKGVVVWKLEGWVGGKEISPEEQWLEKEAGTI